MHHGDWGHSLKALSVKEGGRWLSCGNKVRLSGALGFEEGERQQVDWAHDWRNPGHAARSELTILTAGVEYTVMNVLMGMVLVVATLMDRP